MSRRRWIYLFLAAALLLGAPPSRAQSDRIHRIAYLESTSAEGDEYFKTFRAAMKDLGRIEGRNVVYETRNPVGQGKTAAELIDELIASKPDVLLGWESTAQVMREKTTSIPIVLLGSIDPVAARLARSLRKPGMNVTGVAQLNHALPAKHIELMREIVPRLARAGQFVDKSASGCELISANSRQAARNLRIELVTYPVETAADIERAFTQMEKQRPDVLLPCPSRLMFINRQLLFEKAVQLKIPFTSFVVTSLPHGVLFAYATSHHDIYRKAATYVDKILKGAKPGDLPIEQPSKFELVVNLKTAKALGLSIPQSVLLRADRVIE